ncbi:MAG TPA: hypothetical protein VE262_03700 [Blastocatellia bacterium]|nr:hypothetical protein [Blastocatellia bacterium]
MWNRTKRLINSYLDNLIDKASSPDKEVRAMTRGEIARLNEVEVHARGAIKMLEKELAEVELKLVGAAERERLLQERGEHLAAQSAASDLVALNARRDLLTQQIAEANQSAARARALRDQRRVEGEDLARDTYLTSMRENLAGVQAPFDPTDPAATIDEMRARLNIPSGPSVESQVAQADRELELERARSAVDELLARYKSGIENDDPPRAPETPAPRPVSAVPAEPRPEAAKGEEGPEETKTLGRSEGPIRPID